MNKIYLSNIYMLRKTGPILIKDQLGLKVETMVNELI